MKISVRFQQLTSNLISSRSISRWCCDVRKGVKLDPISTPLATCCSKGCQTSKYQTGLIFQKLWGAFFVTKPFGNALKASGFSVSHITPQFFRLDFLGTYFEVSNKSRAAQSGSICGSGVTWRVLGSFPRITKRPNLALTSGWWASLQWTESLRFTSADHQMRFLH